MRYCFVDFASCTWFEVTTLLCAVSECCELARLELEPFLRRCDKLWKKGEDGLCALTSTDDLGDGLMVSLIGEEE